ncbi:MAG TPA: hypothetical protein VGH03_22045 [Caulobacteraceae bacterium]
MGPQPDDTTIPIASGREVFDVKPGEKGAAVVEGFNHNAIYALTPPAIWTPVDAFILTGALPVSPNISEA